MDSEINLYVKYRFFQKIWTKDPACDKMYQNYRFKGVLIWLSQGHTMNRQPLIIHCA